MKKNSNSDTGRPDQRKGNQEHGQNNHMTSGWNPSFSVGLDSLDKQHKQLLDLCSKAASYLTDRSQDSNDRFHFLLVDILEHATEHFQLEEEILGILKFPDLAEHQALHKEFHAQWLQFISAEVEGIVDRTTPYQMLSTWLEQHMLIEDMSYVRHLLDLKERNLA